VYLKKKQQLVLVLRPKGKTPVDWLPGQHYCCAVVWWELFFLWSHCTWLRYSNCVSY